MIKGSWSKDEDNLLKKIVKENGRFNWSAIASLMKSRNGKQCRERWNNHLDPNVNKDPFTDREREIVFYLHSKYGNKWCKIACELPGRTDNAIKNFYNNCIKRKNKQSYENCVEIIKMEDVDTNDIERRDTQICHINDNELNDKNAVNLRFDRLSSLNKQYNGYDNRRRETKYQNPQDTSEKRKIYNLTKMRSQNDFLLNIKSDDSCDDEESANFYPENVLCEKLFILGIAAEIELNKRNKMIKGLMNSELKNNELMKGESMKSESTKSESVKSVKELSLQSDKNINSFPTNSIAKNRNQRINFSGAVNFKRKEFILDNDEINNKDPVLRDIDVLKNIEKDSSELIFKAKNDNILGDLKKLTYYDLKNMEMLNKMKSDKYESKK
ncbi:Myb protein [Dictyocoela muelleri]|nr:Myb protein [Dictyocoela muelleri]